MSSPAEADPPDSARRHFEKPDRRGTDGLAGKNTGFIVLHLRSPGAPDLPCKAGEARPPKIRLMP